MVQDNFGPYAERESFASAWAYYAERDETRAIEILDRLGVRYVVDDATGAGSVAGLESGAMAFRLGTDFGSFTTRGRGDLIPGLSRHRLIFHSHSAPPGRAMRSLRAQRPYRSRSIGVWEIVPGARIEGKGEPGARIYLSLELETSSRGIHKYRLKSIVDEKGLYHFVVPYPNDVEFSPDVSVAPHYEIRKARTRRKLAIREADVQSGGVVRGPEFQVSADGPG